MRGRQPYARFLLTYRLDTPDGPGTEGPGRGWVVRVPEADEPALAEEPALIWFTSLSDVGDVIKALLDERTLAAAGKRSKTDERLLSGIT